MEKVLQKIQNLEDEVFSLKEKVSSSKFKIKRLEKNLTKSQCEIKELQEAKVKPDTTPTCKCNCGFNKADAVKMTKQLKDVTKRCQDLTQLQNILNNFIVKAQNRPQVDTQIDELRTKLNELQKDFEDTAEKWMIVKPQARIRNRAIPLSFDDCQTLAALENLGGMTERPAWNIYKTMIEKSSDAVKYCQEEEQRLQRGGVTMRLEAMREYKRKIIFFDHSEHKDTKFFRVWDVTDKKMRAGIVAVNLNAISLLDWNTKKVLKLWRRCSINKCYVDFTGRVVLEINSSKKVLLKPGEENAKEIHAAIEEGEGRFTSHTRGS